MRFLAVLTILTALAWVVPVQAMDQGTLTIRLYGQALPQELDSLETEAKTAWGQFKNDAFDKDALETDNAYRVGIDLVGTTPIDPAGIISFIGAFGGSYSKQEFDVTNPAYLALWNGLYDIAVLTSNVAGPNNILFCDLRRQDQNINEVESYMGHLKLGIGVHPLPILHVEALGIAGAGFIDNHINYLARRAPLYPPLPWIVTIRKQSDSAYGYTYEFGGQGGVYLDLGPFQIGVHGGYLWTRQVMETTPQTAGMTLSDYIEQNFLDGNTIKSTVKGFFAGASVGLIF